MANLKDIRTRIQSVKSTMQITNAMKMVSAAKLKKAQEAIENMRPYAEKINELLVSLSRTAGDEAGGMYAEERPVQKVLIVPVTSNRGLCGALNSNVIKETENYIVQLQKQGTEFELLTIGKRAYDAFKKKYSVVENRSDIFDKNVNYEKTMETAAWLMEAFVSKRYDRIELIFSEFKNAGLQKTVRMQYLPVEKPQQEKKGSHGVQLDFIFEPSQTEIVRELIPKSLRVKFLRVIRDAWASEHGARMTAMHKATDNAKEMAAELTLQYNKARQAVITGEILEIVSGAEALKNQG